MSAEDREDWKPEQRAKYASVISGLLMALSVTVARGKAAALLHLQSRVRSYQAGGAAAAPADPDSDAEDGDDGADSGGEGSEADGVH